MVTNSLEPYVNIQLNEIIKHEYELDKILEAMNEP